MASPKHIYVETYGCQMNVADSEVVMSIMYDRGYRITKDLSRADVILVNTCSVRENAEQRIFGRLGHFKRYKHQNPGVVIAILGCMAERLRAKLIDEESVVDVVVGPDEYRKLPSLVEDAANGTKGIAVKLSRIENYDDIVPLRTDGICAWMSIMRGCDKFCTFCIVPFTRGRERSRSVASVVREVEELSARGFKEVTLLGQNVNSYRDGEYDFADLLTWVAAIDRSIRVRFTTSHPQDMSDKLIETIARYENICNYIHLPVQSGSDRVLGLMNRTYDRKHYLNLVKKIKAVIPGVSLSTDIIAGFPTETEDDHRMTLDLLQEVRFDGAFMFKYSPREHTPAYRMGDDVADEVKVRRLTEIIELQHRIAHENNQSLIGHRVEVIVEGESKKSEDEWTGRTETNKVVVFPRGNCRTGEYIRVNISRATSATLFGELVGEAQKTKCVAENEESMFVLKSVTSTVGRRHV
ncbi:MAG: tRNA (N6-isopentenyl adenosine(37)-C2)-methylthiotransferase MiaB [Bacteroidota bacterium]